MLISYEVVNWYEIFNDYCAIEWQRDNTGDVDVNRRTDQKITDFDAAVLKEQLGIKPTLQTVKPTLETAKSAVKSEGFNEIENWLFYVRKKDVRKMCT